MRYFMILSFLLICNGTIPCQNNNAQKKLESHFTNYTIPLAKLMDSLKVNKRQAKIHVSKLKYVLSIAIGSKTIKSYPIVLGSDPFNDKLREGDRCTPEGKFRIKAMYPHKSWSKFIWFDYPNADSYKKHNQAKRNKTIPEHCTIGGDVGIHWVPTGADYAIDARQNWTWGCVSLKNKDIDEIYQFAYIGMEVEIEK